MTAHPAARTALEPESLRAALLRPRGHWRALTVRDETTSTNAEVVDAARHGADEGLVVVAEYQSAGRGRGGRHWRCPPRAGLAVSVLLRPPVPAARWGWLPLLAGVATADALATHTGVALRLKWPNDLLAPVADRDGEYRDGEDCGRAYGAGEYIGGECKCGGILTETAAEAVAVGIGVNVTVGAHELPAATPGAPPPTSLALAGARVTDRHPLLTGMLAELGGWYATWCAADGDPEASGLRAAYQRVSATLGRWVRLVLPGGDECTGTAGDVDPQGRLVLATGQGRRAFAAGDVTHLRHPPSPSPVPPG